VRSYGDPLRKLDPLHPTFQGHWNRHRSNGHPWLPISVP